MGVRAERRGGVGEGGEGGARPPLCWVAAAPRMPHVPLQGSGGPRRLFGAAGGVGAAHLTPRPPQVFAMTLPPLGQPADSLQPAEGLLAGLGKGLRTLKILRRDRLPLAEEINWILQRRFVHHAKEADCILQRGLTVSCEENEILPTKLIDGILQRGLSYRDYMNRLR